jgi:hypothetical protein
LDHIVAGLCWGQCKNGGLGTRIGKGSFVKMLVYPNKRRSTFQRAAKTRKKIVKLKNPTCIFLVSISHIYSSRMDVQADFTFTKIQLLQTDLLFVKPYPV